MNYFEYKDEKLEFVIDYASLKRTTKQLNIKVSDLDSVIDDFENSETLAFEAIKRAAQLNGETTSVKKGEIEDLLSSNVNYSKLLQEFKDAMPIIFKGKSDKKK